MDEAPNMYSNLNDQQQFRVNKIGDVRDYFNADIRERELMSQILSKYIIFFDYFNKSLIALSTTSSGTYIASFAIVIGAPVG